MNAYLMHLTLNTWWCFITSSAQHTVEAVEWFFTIVYNLASLTWNMARHAEGKWERAHVKRWLKGTISVTALAYELWRESLVFTNIDLSFPFAGTIQADQSEALQQKQVDQRLLLMDEQLRLLSETSC